MSNTLQIQCSNPQCQSLNSLEQFFCQQCGTPILKRYLRAIVKGQEASALEQRVNERYLFIQSPIFLETKPSELPYFPESIPNQIIPYLQLFPYRLNIPQVYGQLTPPDENSDPDQAIWLLDYGTLVFKEENLSQGKMFPLMTEKWQEATIIRKLNWLRQIAFLWNPLAKKGVVSTLFNPNLLGVNGTNLQVLELELDQGKSSSLKNLGDFWHTLISQTQSEFQEFFKELCNRLISEKIHSSKQLLAVLDYALEKYGRSQEYKYQIFTLTDAGPSRDHNEDSCYPKPGKVLDFKTNEKALTIVCDGIGGHEGGEVASSLAIETLENELKKLTIEKDEYSSEQIINYLQQSTFLANTKISEVNDKERRQERQRMGTTVVMALAYNHQIYLAHVGDSRIYLITRNGVSQLTLDDDLASREVRLGYAIYRDAVRYPSAGALVQALGMGSSNNLHPTIQNLTFDEDCVLLLCSDGLSDFDRVDQYWDKEILPLIKGEKDIETVGKTLIDIANTRNGHDNATIGILHCQVKSKSEDPQDQTVLSWTFIDQNEIIPTIQPPTAKIEQSNSKEGDIETQPFYEESEPKKSPFLIYVSIMIVLIAIAGIALYWDNINGAIKDLIGKTPKPEMTTPSTPETETPSSESKLKEKELYIVSEELILEAKIKPPTEPEGNTLTPEKNSLPEKVIIPKDSVIQLFKKEDEDTKKALIRVCYNSSKQEKIKDVSVAKEKTIALISLADLEGKNYAKYDKNNSKVTLEKIEEFCPKETTGNQETINEKEATDNQETMDKNN